MDQYALNESISVGAPGPFEYKIEPSGDGSGFYATVPYRRIFYYGKTEQEALGQLLRGVSELARRGALDPSSPDQPGLPPIQHVLGLLTEALQWQLTRRREKVLDLARGSLPEPKMGTGSNEKFGGPVDPQHDGSALLSDSRFIRDNEIIAGISTAIAALARVKEL